MTTTYCEVSDLMFGNIPAPADAATWCQRATDEIDSRIGLIYSTPIIFGSDPARRPGKLLIKNVCAHLATGRAVLALSAGGADDQNNAYGLYLVNEALKVLERIASGDIILPGVPAVDSTDGAQANGPLILNVDEVSLVEGFSATFGNPAVNILSGPRYPDYLTYPRG